MADPSPAPRAATQACISAIEYYLPDGTLTNEELAHDFPSVSAEAIFRKTGVRCRRIADPSETAVDLAVKAAAKLFEKDHITPAEIDFVILCTQSPDFFLPTSACIVQDRLGIPRAAGCFDMNQGCSGFIYGLAAAKGLVESGSAGRVLLLTADTYTKLIRPSDWSVRSLFSDGAAATLVSTLPADNGAKPFIGPFSFGTDGSGADRLIVRTGGFRAPVSPGAEAPHIEMNGPGIFSFALEQVPKSICALLEKDGTDISEVDLFVLHQASSVVLDALRRALHVTAEKFFINLADRGNLVSSTIPVALCDAHAQGRIRPADTILLSGFGVGLSWATSLIRFGGPLAP